MLQIATRIARQARCRGPYPALTFDGETHDHARFAEGVHRTANALATLGIRRGDKVATVLANCRELAELYWAAPSLGAVNVPLSPLPLGPGLASLLADSHAACLVTQRSMLPAVESIRAELPQPLADRVLLIDGEAPDCLDLRALVERAPAAPPGVRVESSAAGRS